MVPSYEEESVFFVTALPLQAYIINFTVIAVTLDGLLASIQSKSNCHAHYLPIPSLLQACFILFLRRRLMVIRANPVAGMYVSQPSILFYTATVQTDDGKISAVKIRFECRIKCSWF